MEINCNYAFEDFQPWSGAVDTWNTLEEFNKISTLECILEDIYPDGIDETTLNDILWFEEESVFEWVGLHYSNNTGVVSDEPLCPICNDYITGHECTNCYETLCEHCTHICSKCSTVICKDCDNGDNGIHLCSDCYDTIEETLDE